MLFIVFLKIMYIEYDFEITTNTRPIYDQIKIYDYILRKNLGFFHHLQLILQLLHVMLSPVTRSVFSIGSKYKNLRKKPKLV